MAQSTISTGIQQEGEFVRGVIQEFQTRLEKWLFGSELVESGLKLSGREVARMQITPLISPKPVKQQ
jgi:hypothetical protein